MKPTKLDLESAEIGRPYDVPRSVHRPYWRMSRLHALGFLEAERDSAETGRDAHLQGGAGIGAEVMKEEIIDSAEIGREATGEALSAETRSAAGSGRAKCPAGFKPKPQRPAAL